MAVVCDHYLFRNISSLPEYALAGKLLTEQGREPTINSTRVTFTWKASAIQPRHRSSQADKGLWELLLCSNHTDIVVAVIANLGICISQ